MDSEKSPMFCTLLFRGVLPISLFGAMVVRYNAFSLAYMLLFLICPLLPGPRTSSIAGYTGRYLITLSVVSSIMLVAQVIFQGTLLGIATDARPYGTLLGNCTAAEHTFREIGLQRMELDNVGNIVRTVGPDIGMCIVSLIVTISCFKFTPRNQSTVSNIPMTSLGRIRMQQHTRMLLLNMLGQLLMALLLGLSGIMLPSLLSAVYFLSFLAMATWWGCYKSLGKRFAMFRIVLLVYSALHLVLLYLYQFQFFQEVLKPTSFYSRLFGITGILRTDCGNPWLVRFHKNKWPVFVNPAVILFLYMLLATETRRWYEKSNTHSRNSRLKRRATRGRVDESERQALVEDGEQPQSYQTMSPTNADNGLKLPRRQLRALSLQRLSQWLDTTNDNVQRERSALNSIFAFLMKQSYAASLIVMMVWSITYHSWLTFVYLLSACIIWMIPAKRKICLVCSPLIVTYAEGLLLMQYIYGFDLHEPGELPDTTSSGHKFSQIGLVSYNYPCLQLAVQVFFTFFFWLTLRQYLGEIKRISQREMQGGLPLGRVGDVENGSTPPTPTMQPATDEEDNSNTGPLRNFDGQSYVVVDGYDSEEIKAAGKWIWHIMCKYWILVCAGLYLVMAVQEAVIYRIIYMFFFCYFVITFKLCYQWWRLTINVFWWVTIIYSMLILCIIYTYQFDMFPEYWQNSTGLTPDILHDLGLRQFDIATLFLKLLTPTSFLIIIILQLHYFQKPFLIISDITRFTFEEETVRPVSAITVDRRSVTDTVAGKSVIGGSHSEAADRSVSYKKSRYEYVVHLAKTTWTTSMVFFDNLSILLWRTAEVHWMKVVVTTMFISCLIEVCAINIVFVVLLLVILPIPRLHFLMTGLSLIWAAIASIAKMLFQLSIIKHDFWFSNCSEVTNFNYTPYPFNNTINNAEFIGLTKTNDLAFYLQRYIFIIFVIGFHGIIQIHQKQYFIQNSSLPTGIIFKDIKRSDADRNVLSCLKFFVNYAFFKFGLELCYVITVVTIVSRLDAFSLIYGFLLGVLLLMPSRKATSIIWPFYIVILVVLLLIQYLACLGAPVGVCWGYPWDTMPHFVTRNLQIFLYLPNYAYGPDPYKLSLDYFQLLLACQQWRIFYLENSAVLKEFGGGDNQDILAEVEANRNNPIKDFLSCQDSYLDYFKTAIFQNMFWVTLVIVFIAGTTRISLFCMGYLVGVFSFLWLGQEMLVKPLKKLLRLWHMLLWYNYFVIMCKSALQLIGCVYLQNMVDGFCWLIQLLSIVCLSSGHYVLTVPEKVAACALPQDQAGLRWDAICFVFLLFQIRIYKSHYFRHVVTELKIQNKLATRGAELINGNLIKRVEDQKTKEAEVLSNIKRKMERIKLRQQKLHNKTPLFDAQDHYQVIRSGDYYMFEVDSDDDLESSVDVLADFEILPENKESEPKIGPLEILNAAMTGGTRMGLQMAHRKSSVNVHSRKVSNAAFDLRAQHNVRGRFSHDAHIPFMFDEGKRESKNEEHAEDTERRERLGDKESRDDQEGKEEREDRWKVPREDTGCKDLLEAEEEQEEEESRHSKGGKETKEDETKESGEGKESEERTKSKAAKEIKGSSDGTTERTERMEGSQHKISEASKDDTCTFINNSVRLLLAVIGSFLDYLISTLRDISREYRQVAKVLDEEKEQEKQSMNQGERSNVPLVTVDWHMLPQRDNQAATSATETEEYKMDGHSMQLKMALRKIYDDRELSSCRDTEEEFRENTPRIFQLLIALFEAMISQSALLCYFAMILNHLVSASLLSLPYPVSVFLWAMLSVPRPTKTYWITIITYTEAVIVVKYLFQFAFFPWNTGVSVHEEGPFWPPGIIGIEKKVAYAAFDLFLLVSLFIHRSVLKRNGLWKDAVEAGHDLAKAEQDHELLVSMVATPDPGSPAPECDTLAFGEPHTSDIEECPLESTTRLQDPLLGATGSTANLDQGSSKKKAKSTNELAVENPPLSVKKKPFGPSLCDTCWVGFQKFYGQMRNSKFNAVTDVYAFMFLCDFINFFIIVFGYKSFGPSPWGSETSQANRGNVVNDVLQENKVPMPFLVMLLLQFVLIIIDRALYLRKYVIGKFLYQIFLVVLIHMWMFFILPAISGRRFVDNIPAQLWYFVKCIYFGLSAYQIRSGYPTRIIGNFLTKKYNYVNLFLFKGFLAIPFLLELRALMDWIWTDTTLAITSWLEMEDIYANIFQLKCWRRAEEAYPTPRGQLLKRGIKYGMGGLILFILLFIIWFPLLLFSLADTVLFEVNPPISCDMKISLGGYQPIFQMSSQQQFIRHMTQAEFTRFTSHFKSDPEAIAWLTSFKPNDVSVVTINGESTTNWGISPPSRESLLNELHSQVSIDLIVTTTFGRVPKSGIITEITRRFVRELDPKLEGIVDIREQFANLISGRSNDTLYILDIFPRYLRLPGSDPPQMVPALGGNYNDRTNVTFDLERDNATSVQWWELSEYRLNDLYDIKSGYTSKLNLTIIAFSNRVAPSGLTFFTGYGIIGLYVSLVLVVGRFVRLFFSGLSMQVMFQELPNVDKVLKLCLDVYLVREVRDLQLEEELFAKLLFLYRSPDTLVKWTRQKVS